MEVYDLPTLPRSVLKDLLEFATKKSPFMFDGQYYTAISINVVGSKLQAYATRPNGSVGRSRRLLHVLNTNEV